jgi:hypothetical protein
MTEKQHVDSSGTQCLEKLVSISVKDFKFNLSDPFFAFILESLEQKLSTSFDLIQLDHVPMMREARDRIMDNMITKRLETLSFSLLVSIAYFNSNLKARRSTKKEDFTFMIILKEKLPAVLTPEIYNVCFLAAEISMNGDNKNGMSLEDEVEKQKQLEGIDFNIYV